VGLVELPEIFLTHYHADHYLGLPGMLKTFALRGREAPLTVYGPPGLKDLFGILRILRREVELVRFPVESHELTRAGSPIHREMRFETILEWFDRHLSPGEVREPERSAVG